MSINKLVAMIAPPKTPLDNEGDWRPAEIVVGAEFPPDFQELVTRCSYGKTSPASWLGMRWIGSRNWRGRKNRSRRRSESSRRAAVKRRSQGNC